VSYPFNPDHGLIVVQSELFGPSGSMVLRLALNTGATVTMINFAPLTTVGYDPSLVPDRVQVTTGTGVEYAPRMAVTRIKAMGRELSNFPVLAHTLPPSASVDSLLGLDFLRNQIVNIDFHKGNISFK
jgi:aspartyl protease family protein